MSARCPSQCHEVSTQHGSELVLARQPERLTGFDDVQRPLRRPVELQDSTPAEWSTSTTMWLTTKRTSSRSRSGTTNRSPSPGTQGPPASSSCRARSRLITDPVCPQRLTQPRGVSEGSPSGHGEQHTNTAEPRPAGDAGFLRGAAVREPGAPPDEWDHLIIGRGDIWLHFTSRPHDDPLSTASSCYLYVDDRRRAHRASDA